MIECLINLKFAHITKKLYNWTKICTIALIIPNLHIYSNYTKICTIFIYIIIYSIWVFIDRSRLGRTTNIFLLKINIQNKSYIDQKFETQKIKNRCQSVQYQICILAPLVPNLHICIKIDKISLIVEFQHLEICKMP